MALNHVREQSILDKMQGHEEYLFCLTGSQYFIGHGNDIDYFVQETPNLEKWLLLIGFQHISKNAYGDSNCTMVLRAFSGNQQIDVQVVRDWHLKKSVQEMFKREGLTHPTQEQWNTAFMVERMYRKEKQIA